jgi:nicotinamidase-related amidase
MKIKANYYQQFDADYSLDVPAEGYGGWKQTDIDISPEHTAVVAMHAWDTGTHEEFPGWWRCVEYLSRADKICRNIFPKLLSAVRASPLRLFHVVDGGNRAYKDRCEGLKHAVTLAGPKPAPVEKVEADPMLEELRQFKNDHVFVGAHNHEDTNRGFARLDFPEQARPLPAEGVAENAHQLFALCKESDINHLIYVGFAINWCVLLAPGGMRDMGQHGIMCSTIAQAVTAVENRETARGEINKQSALWRVAVAYGFVFDLDNFICSLHRE